MVVFKRPPLEERIAARQRERGPMKPGKYFDQAPTAIVFFGVIGAVIITHIIAFIMIAYAPH
jgi:hypothetical protein